jgi:hypothetical protein
MAQELRAGADGSVVSSEGWAVRFLTPEMLEYCDGRAACLVNVAYLPQQHTSEVFATESSSELFPDLHRHLQSALRHFRGSFVVI